MFVGIFGTLTAQLLFNKYSSKLLGMMKLKLKNKQPIRYILHVSSLAAMGAIAEQYEALDLVRLTKQV